MEQTVLGARIRDARKAADLSQEQLSALLDIPRSAISEIENGRRGLSASELFAMSKHLRRRLDYFVGERNEPVPKPESFNVRFRSLQLRAGDADTVFRFEQRCRDYKWLEEILTAPMLTQPPAYPLGDPVSWAEAKVQGEKLAVQERNRLALGFDPVRDPFDIVESQGVRVILMDLETPEVSGVFHFDDELGACILINTACHPNRRPYDLMHEYCHVLVDRFEGTDRITDLGDSADPIERRADAFAASFLLPEQGVERFLATRGVARGAVEYLDIFYVMTAFGASFQATVYRLKELGFLEDYRADAYLTSRNVTEMARRIRRAEGVEDVDFDDPAQRRFGQLALRAYKQGKISIGRVAELLDVDSWRQGNSLGCGAWMSRVWLIRAASDRRPAATRHACRVARAGCLYHDQLPAD